MARTSIRSRQKWLTVRKTVQIATLLLFVAFVVMARRGGWPTELVNIPARLDPLLMLAQALATRALLIGSLLALIMIVLTLIFGRVWCGWLCPLGTVLDLFTLKRWRKKNVGMSDRWRAVKYLLLLTIFIAALFGNLSLLIFDPITIMVRTVSIGVWPATDQVVIGVERALYEVPFLQEPIGAIDTALRPAVFPIDPAYYRDIALFALIFVAIIALNAFAPRFWCRYLCPLGGLLGVISKIAIFRREVQGDCNACGACQIKCPTDTIDPERGFASDPAECTVCLECWAVCAQSGVKFPAHRSFAQRREYDPNRRQALIALGATITGLAVLTSDAVMRRDQPHWLRPPGSRENDLLDKCVRCNLCSRACPTNGLQPSITEAGLVGLWTPVLIPRLGYCDYACNACGQVCPVQAIPPLSLEEKRQRVIGQAYIDQNRCIAWAEHRDCIVCEEMCPLPDKAIKLDKVQVLNNAGVLVTIQLPRIDHQKCIGCGICEFKCPVNGQAAIRVYTPTSIPPTA
ncbi:MAG: 4Fe-4S binding protein [Anaerolineae bacterium]